MLWNCTRRCALISIVILGVKHVTNMLLCNIKGKLPPKIQMNARDLELNDLVLEIQASSDRKDRAIRKKIDRLLKEISSDLAGARQALLSRWSGIPDIKSIVDEAVNITLLEALKNIDRYESEYRVMQWIGWIFNRRFQDVMRKYRARYESVSIEANPTIEAQIDKMSEMESESRADELVKFIQTDPEGHFAKAHIKGKPEATLQKILLMRLARRTFQNIAEEFAIDTHTTIASFHDRQLRKLNDYFRKYLC